MVEITIYYIKDINGNVAYTNTNELEFGDFVNKRLELGLGRYVTFEKIKNSVTDLTDLEVGEHKVTINP